MSFVPSDYWDITKNRTETHYLYQIFLDFIFFMLLMVVIWNLILQEDMPTKIKALYK